MPRVIEQKDDYVTLGVVDKDLQPHTELRSITFVDHNGTPHTVHAHKEGPFNTVEKILAGWEDGVLHAFDTHEKASAFERDRGNVKVADRLAAIDQPAQQQAGQQQGGAY